MHHRSLSDHSGIDHIRPSHPYYAGTAHVGRSPPRKTLRASSGEGGGGCPFVLD